MPPKKSKCKKRKSEDGDVHGPPVPHCVVQEKQQPKSPVASGSEGHDSEIDSQEGKKKKQRTRTHPNMTKENQQLMVEWLKQHEILYNKKLEGYKDTKKKNYIWQQQADALGIKIDELRVWYTSLRTRFTKLNKKKSGDGLSEMTERDQWVLDNFSFLAPFTYEVKKRTVVSLKSKIPPPSASSIDLVDDELRDTPSGEMTSQESGNQKQVIPNQTAASAYSISSAPKPSDSFSSAISGKMEQFIEMQNRIMQQMVRPKTDRMKEVFIDYIRESVYDIHPTLWIDLHRDIMKTLLTYKDKDGELKKVQQRDSRSSDTSSIEPCGSSGWQPPPETWPSTVHNPVSVFRSTEPEWVQQQFPQQQQLTIPTLASATLNNQRQRMYPSGARAFVNSKQQHHHQQENEQELSQFEDSD